MTRNDFYRGAALPILLCLLLASGMIAGCTSPSGSTDSRGIVTAVSPVANASPVERVEVFHFHGDKQCASCIAVGDLAEKTVNENFRDELASGRLVFAHVNAQKPENAALAEKYGVTGSSLWIGVYSANGFSKEQDLRVWSLINDKDLYSAYLSGVITKRLNGDFS